MEWKYSESEIEIPGNRKYILTFIIHALFKLIEIRPLHTIVGDRVVE